MLPEEHSYYQSFQARVLQCSVLRRGRQAEQLCRAHLSHALFWFLSFILSILEAAFFPLYFWRRAFHLSLITIFSDFVLLLAFSGARSGDSSGILPRPASSSGWLRSFRLEYLFVHLPCLCFPYEIITSFEKC